MNRKRDFTIAIALTIVILIFDVQTPVGYASWLLYFIPFFVATPPLKRSHVPLLTFLATLLIIASYFFSPPGGNLARAAVNRAVGILVLWWISFIVIKRKQAEEALSLSFRELEQRVEDRTTEIKEVNAALIVEIGQRKRAEEEITERGAMMQQIMDTANVAIFLVDRSGRIAHANRHMAEMFGCPIEEIVGSEYLDHVHPSEQASGRQKMLALLASEISSVDIEHLFWQKSGTQFWGHLTGQRFHDVHGNELGLIGVITNISIRKQAEEALRENQSRLDLALQSAHMGVWRFDIDQKKHYFDDLTCQLLGIDATTFTGAAEEFYQAVHPEDREKIKAALARTIEQDILYESSYRIIWLDGSVHYIAARGRLVRNDKGFPARINGILWDITDQRLFEDERLKTQKLESIGTLAGGIAHDFNNLLQGIFGFISMAKLTLDQKEKSLDMLTQAEKALHQSVNLTSQLLTFSKGGKPVKKVFALRPLIENSVAFALSGSRIKYEIAMDGNPRTVEADEGQIGQVIQNIVLNAAQAMPLGGMIRVSVRNMPAAAIVPPADLQGNLVEISIRDQGMGIPADNLTRIFDPYYTTKEKGSGLGLATAYSIIKNHEGLVRIQSEVGKGTTVFIYLPLTSSEVEEPIGSASPATIRKGRILIMDDEEMIREVAGELLTALGHDVAVAETGESALAAYWAAREASLPFDAVILDLTIRGGMGGMETLQKLIELDPDVNAIVSSGYSDDAALSNYRKQGFRSFLKKPYNIEDLRRTLNSVLNDSLNSRKK